MERVERGRGGAEDASPLLFFARPFAVWRLSQASPIDTTHLRELEEASSLPLSASREEKERRLRS